MFRAFLFLNLYLKDIDFLNFKIFPPFQSQ